MNASKRTWRRRRASIDSGPRRQGGPVDVLLANAGHGLGTAFLDQDFDEARHVIDTNITGTIYLVQNVARRCAPVGRAAS